jgi:predicted AlkP superfamily pyrophosphatase or phosphodiesterase
MKNQQSYCVVISYDAFSKDNWDYALKQPHLASLVQKGAATCEMKSVYPTLTYVIHSSYVTGMYPKTHKVYHNNPLQAFVPEQEQEWHWYRENIHAKTVYDVAFEHGLTTAAILWPVTAKAHSIKYNLPEVRALGTENQALKILRTGSPLYSMMLEFKYGKLRKGIEQPYLDNFSTKAAVDTIKRKAPNLMLLHLIELDDTKHLRGTKGAHIEETIERMDTRIGEIIQAVKDKGIEDQTTFIIVGDHGQLDVRYKINLNTLLKEQDFIYEDPESFSNELTWTAYVQAAGGSAYVHIRKSSDVYEEVLRLLQQFAEDPDNGIEAIYTKHQLQEMGVHDVFSIMLEAKEGYAFDDHMDGELIVDIHAQGKVYATHGYSPNKPDYTSNLVIAGPNIKQGVRIPNACVIDLAPTIARILNIPFPTCDGKELSEIFIDEI